MLVRRLVVVEKCSDSRILLVLINLLAQDLELKLHEVNLLLQVDDVLIRGVVIVWVATELLAVRAAFLLPVELHLVHRVVACRVSERPGPAPLSATLG